MELGTDITLDLTPLFSGEYIAFGMLIVCLIFSGAFNIFFVWFLVKMKDVFVDLLVSLKTLNKKLEHHDNDKDPS